MKRRKEIRVLFVGVTPLGFERFKQRLKKEFSGRLAIDVCSRSSDAIELVRNKSYDAVICDITVGQIVKGKSPDIPPFDFLRVVNKINPSAQLIVTNFHYYQFHSAKVELPEVKGIEVIDCRRIVNNVHPLDRLAELIRSLPKRVRSTQKLEIPWELMPLQHITRLGQKELIQMAGFFKGDHALLKAVAMGLPFHPADARDVLRESLRAEARLTKRMLAKGTQISTNSTGELPKRTLNRLVDAWQRARSRRHRRPR